MAGIIDRIHGETLRELGDDLLEKVELRPQRVQKNQRRAFARLDVAKADAVDADIPNLDVSAPRRGAPELAGQAASPYDERKGTMAAAPRRDRTRAKITTFDMASSYD